MRPSRCPLQQSAASSSESGSILERAEQPRADPDRVTPPKREDRAPSRMPPNPVNPKKRPRADPDEYFFDLKLEKMPVLEAVGTFAQCLADFAVSFAVGCWLVSESVHLLTVSSDSGASLARMNLSNQVFYELTRTSAGFQASLRIPAWSDTSYEGEAGRVDGLAFCAT